MSGDAGDWVREGTPQEADATWADEQSDYGTAVSPEEWDDYSVEQSVPVAPPQPQTAAADAAAEPVELGDEAEAGLEQREVPSEADDAAATAARPSGVGPDDVEASTADALAGEAETPAASAELGQAGLESVADPAVVDTANADDADSQFRAPAEEPQAAEAKVVDDDELEATKVRPGVVAAAAGAAALGAGAAAASTPALPDGLYRHTAADDTAVLAAPVAAGYPDADEQEAEGRRLQEQLAAERQARNQRLGVVDTSEANEVRDSEGFIKLNTDKFFPSSGLFVLRVITAGIIGIAGYRILMAIPETAAKFEATIIPEPRLVAWILGFTLGALALLLVIGLLQRLVGFVLLAIAAASLVFLRWGNFNIFSATWEGFPLLGDKELLLAGIGFLLLTMGGGSWGIDGAFRRSRANAKAEKVG